MKKNVRLVLLFALIAVMLVMTAVFASAATTEAELKSEIAAGNATVAGDITVTEGIVIDKATTITGTGTITFTGEGSLFTVTGSGNVTLDGVKATADAKTLVNADVNYTGTLTLNNCVFSVTGNCYMIRANCPGTIEVIGASTHYTHTGGAYGSNNNGIFSPETKKNANEEAVAGQLNIRAGSFATDGRTIIQVLGSTTVPYVTNIYGGNFTSTGSYIVHANNDGTVNIYGGTFVGINNYAGASLFRVSDGYASLNLHGGTFTQKGQGAVSDYHRGAYIVEKNSGYLNIEKAEDATLVFNHEGAGGMFYFASTDPTIEPRRPRLQVQRRNL